MTATSPPPARLAVLVVDDQPAVVSALRLLFELHDLPVQTASRADQALAAVAAGRIGVVVQDMNFSRGATSGAEGAELFRAIRRQDPDMPVLLLTAWASLQSAVQLAKEGATDYLAKPWDDDRLVGAVGDLLSARERQAGGEFPSPRPASGAALAGGDVGLARTAPGDAEPAARASPGRPARSLEGDLCGLVFASDAMRHVVSLALTVAPADAPVLLVGPSGSGKEKIAEIVHANSRRRRGPLVRVNVGAIPVELAEAELFGAEVGAFTGAKNTRIGHFEAADGGTLFLDELDAMPPALQVKLLRVLQSGEIQRLGASRPRQTDVRIVAATNGDLDAAVVAGRFRQDLLYRLDVVRIAIPPLAARPTDVLPLTRHFLATLPPAATRARPELGADALAALARHDWPGNVRELQNRVHRALLVGGATLGAADLGFAPAGGRTVADREITAGATATLTAEGAAARQEIEALLRAVDGSIAAAARRLGLSRQALYRRMDRLGIALERRLRG